MTKRIIIVLFIISLPLVSCQFFIPGMIDGDKITLQVKLSDSLFLEPNKKQLLKKLGENSSIVLIREIDSVDLSQNNKFFLSNGKVYLFNHIEEEIHEVDRDNFDIEFQSIMNVN